MCLLIVLCVLIGPFCCPFSLFHSVVCSSFHGFLLIFLYFSQHSQFFCSLILFTIYPPLIDFFYYPLQIILVQSIFFGFINSFHQVPLLVSLAHNLYWSLPLSSLFFASFTKLLFQSINSILCILFHCPCH